MFPNVAKAMKYAQKPTPNNNKQQITKDHRNTIQNNCHDMSMKNKTLKYVNRTFFHVREGLHIFALVDGETIFVDTKVLCFVYFHINIKAHSTNSTFQVLKSKICF